MRFERGDAFALEAVEGSFTAALAAFWWSHVEHDRQARFLRTLGRRLPRSAPIVMIDNRFVVESSTPIAWRDDRGNTYQDRILVDGSVHRVLKNFPDRRQLLDALTPHALPAESRSSDKRAAPVEVQMTHYYWRTLHRALGPE